MQNTSHTMDNGSFVIALNSRIDTNNAAEVERELLALLDEHPGQTPVLDAANLAYISSAGLRVLMKLRKQAGKVITVENVSREVYDIFETTGFTELLDVKKALRSISIEGLEVIGMGATAQVYRLDRETVLKVFKPSTSLEVIQKENEQSKNAFLHGIPTAISYDVVRVGACYGTVYELLDAQVFLTVLVHDKAHLDEHIRRFAASIRELYRIKVNPRRFPPLKAVSLNLLSRLEGLCTREEIGKLKQLYEIVPERSTFIHGDCHPGNVMVQNGELMFIDLMTCGSGHPVFDLVSMCAVYHMPPMFRTREENPLLRSFSVEETARIGEVYLRSYLDAEDEALLRRAERQITAFAAARSLFAALFLPGFLSLEKLEKLKWTVLSYVDEGLEPLVF